MTVESETAALFVPESATGTKPVMGIPLQETAAFQFVDAMKWTGTSVCTGNAVEVEYLSSLRGNILELSPRHESRVDTMLKVMQAIPSDPFKITFTTRGETGPTLIVARHVTTDYRLKCVHRCITRFNYENAYDSPDIQAFIAHGKYFKEIMTDSLDSLLPTKRKLPAPNIDDFTATAKNILMQAGIRLPCRIQVSGKIVSGIAVLERLVDAATFDCKLLFEEAVELTPGTELDRVVKYVQPRTNDIFHFQSQVGKVIEVY